MPFFVVGGKSTASAETSIRLTTPIMMLPGEERRRILAEQASAPRKHYNELADREEPGGGDFFEY